MNLAGKMRMFGVVKTHREYAPIGLFKDVKEARKFARKESAKRKCELAIRVFMPKVLAELDAVFACGKRIY